MNDALASLGKRGPDDHGTLAFPHALLGHTRLSIIDLSNGGHQPMQDAERDIAISFNGEIYNYRELKKELEERGHQFRTESDTEVILKCYAEYGAEGVAKLDGMFAFALWDNRRGELLLARDRFGKKPLYYTVENETLYAASELKALRALGIERPISKEALDNYLRLMYLPPWKSIYEGIYQLPPAHYGVFKDGKLTTTRYWHIPHRPLAISYDEAKNEVRRLLREAVQKRMLASDVEVGALLSGGVDSTFVSLLAAESLEHPLKTFALGYGDYINELPYAEQAAQAIGSEHYTLQASSDMIEELEKVTTYFDEPHADNSDFPQHLISQLAASKVKVALSGDGGDELFFGYGWHTRHENLSYRAHTFEKVFLSPFPARVRATRIFPPLERLALWGSPLPLNNDIYAHGAYSPEFSDLEKINIFDLTTYLPGQLLTKVDRTSMMHSLEVRSPFLDTALVEFVFNLPPSFKTEETNKRILKDLLAEHMPHDFVYRRKQGFGAPTAKWLRDSRMSEYTRTQLGKDALCRTYLNSSLITWYLHDFYEKRRDRGALRIWVLLCLEIWLRHRTDR